MTTWEDVKEVLERVARWRSVLAGWRIGSKPPEAPGVKAERDLRELAMMLRIEVSALVGVLLVKGVISHDEWYTALINEARETEHEMTARFPGMRATDYGMEFYDAPLARDTMKRMGFPD